ncbi:hypothetical protein CHLRE_06g254077v5 [Chlamydomonas reinhardtii]|uniref:GIY-YIG domain-containing protein n=1 Tax=Chlamydomonas reinhardtii TaxID=3055 RepID=A0A2K3DM74_CHLRE|nr:uncharacterized protein CHLRE_06g254077v5 [Chlamydomonas reinhardtii]PNW81635.1 hypothetical protein CHLRE_06g254077v5 [Chlamydomonas reinhardtii]
MAVACAVAVRPLVQVAVASAVSTAAPASSKPAVKLAASAVSAVALTTVSVSAGLLATTAVEDPRFHAADCQSRSADASASCEDLQPSTSTCTSAVADANRPTRRVRRSGSKAQRRGSTTLTASVPSMAAAVVLPPKIALRRRHRLRLRAGHSATAAATDKTPREQPDKPAALPEDLLPADATSTSSTGKISSAAVCCGLLAHCSAAQLHAILCGLVQAVASSSVKGNNRKLLLGSKLRKLLEGVGVAPANGKAYTAADVAALSGPKLERLRATLKSQPGLLLWFLLFTAPAKLQALQAALLPGGAGDRSFEEWRAAIDAVAGSGHEQLAAAQEVRGRQSACVEGSTAGNTATTATITTTNNNPASHGGVYTALTGTEVTGKKPAALPEDLLPADATSTSSTGKISSAAVCCGLLAHCSAAQLHAILCGLVQAVASSSVKGNNRKLLLGSKLRKLLEGVGVAPANGKAYTAADVAALSGPKLERLRATLKSQPGLLLWFLLFTSPAELQALQAALLPGGAGDRSFEEWRAAIDAVAGSGHEQLAAAQEVRGRQSACVEGSTAGNTATTATITTNNNNPASHGGVYTALTGTEVTGKAAANKDLSRTRTTSHRNRCVSESGSTRNKSRSSSSRSSSTHSVEYAEPKAGCSQPAATVPGCVPEIISAAIPPLAPLALHIRRAIVKELLEARPPGWNTFLYSWLQAAGLSEFLPANGTCRMYMADRKQLVLRVGAMREEQVDAFLTCMCKAHGHSTWLARYLHMLGPEVSQLLSQGRYSDELLAALRAAGQKTLADAVMEHFWGRDPDPEDSEAGEMDVKPWAERLGLLRFDMLAEQLRLPPNADGSVKNFSNGLVFKVDPLEVWSKYTDGEPSAGALSGMRATDKEARDKQVKQLRGVPLLYLWRIGGRVVYVGMSGGWVKGSRIARYLAEGPGFSESSKMLPWLTAIDEGKEIELRVITLEGLKALEGMSEGMSEEEVQKKVQKKVKELEKHFLCHVDCPCNKVNNGSYRVETPRQGLLDKLKEKYKIKVRQQSAGRQPR